MLPTKAEMDELDRLLEQASGILMRWRFKMGLAERTEHPTVFGGIDRAEKAVSGIADALTAISAELGFGVLRERRPLTYSDWVNLAEDIKDKYPDDPVMRASVNFSLNQILMKEQRTEGWSEESAERAKRWLVEKAGELGVR